MSLNPGTRLGPYEVTAQIGAGGMGEVYRARDTKLNRDVAVKVLPELFALDPNRLTRFRREAHVLASLNHSNIAAIYGFEEASDVKALVLELVEGPTLADRIARGRLPLDEALPVARQIAEALEAAHERGIIHRDLKPANIKVRADGMVKVLDFGLAKVPEPGPVGADHSESPTIESPVATRAGLIIGTAAYMAPEQARGKAADKRADLWAYGCVLYEMLTGVRAFPGEDVAETLATVITREPDWRALAPETPAPIRRLLRRCFVKDPKGRMADASMARIEIDEARSGATVDIPAPQTTSRRKERIAWVSALALVTAFAVASIVWALRPAPPAAEQRFEINTPPTTDPASLAISPDGQKIVFVATSVGRAMLWLRPFASGTAAPMAGTDGAIAPFWSPDSRTVAFFTTTDNQLKLIEIDSGSLRTLGTFPLGTGGTWNRDGTILFSSLTGPANIFRISSKGGEAAAVTGLEPALVHQVPQFLPDGRHFLYFAPALNPRGVHIGQLDGSETRRLLDADAAATYVPSGYLLFLRQRTLFAQAFDPVRLVLTGNPFRVAAQVASMMALAPAVSVSATGTLVYRSGSTLGSARPLIWFDRSGKEIERVSENAGTSPSLSRDGSRVVLQGAPPLVGPPEIGLLTLDRGGVASRVTSNGNINLDPVWSPDDSEIVFSSSDATGAIHLYRKPMTRDGKEELLLKADRGVSVASDWSRDGRFLLYGSSDRTETHSDIWALSLKGDRKAFPVVETMFEEKDGQFSPDGKWIAYQSNETGRFEIYVQPFPGPGRKETISSNGGAQVRWRRDARELFYIALDGRLMAVPIQFAPDGQTFKTDPPVALFATSVGGAVQGLARQQYVVSLDGQKFLMSLLPEDPSPSPITVILNWKPRP